MKRRACLVMPAVTVVWCLAALLALAGCDKGSESSGGSPSAGGGPKKKLYWVQPIRGHVVHRLTQVAFEEACGKLGYDCEIVGTDDMDSGGTISLAEQALAKGDVAGMAVWAGDPSYYPFIEKAGKQGIPVIIPHFPAEQKDVPGATGVVSCDPAAYGRDAALEIGKVIGGKGTVAITQGASNVTEDLVSKAFIEAMKEKYPDVKVLPPQMEGFDPVQAISKAAAILQANPDVVGALSTTGGEPPTWPGAAAETKRKVVSITMNYTRRNLDAIRDGEMHAAVAQPLWEESYKAAELLDGAIKGNKPEWWTKMPAPLITKENLAPYYELMDKADAAISK